MTAAFEDGSFSFDHGTRPYGEAPADAQELIAELTFKPALRLGAAYLLVDDLTISSDVHYRFGDGIAFDPSSTWAWESNIGRSTSCTCAAVWP